MRVFSPANSRVLSSSTVDEICSNTIYCFSPPDFSEDIHHAAQPSVSLGLRAQSMKKNNLARKRQGGVAGRGGGV